MKNKKLKKDFTQVCIWEGITVGPKKIKKFEKNMAELFGLRVQYLEEVKTGPDMIAGLWNPGLVRLTWKAQPQPRNLRERKTGK